MATAIPFKKITLIFLLLLPLLNLINGSIEKSLGPDPGKVILLSLGYWAMVCLWLTLLITPLRYWLNDSRFIVYRRTLGLMSVFYATLHLLVVMTYVLGWNWQQFLVELQDRPYMLVGIMAWLLMLPLALSSNKWAMRKLRGGWKRLHQLIYLIAPLVLVHFYWLVRSDFREVLIFFVLLVLLMADRYIRNLKVKNAV